jgi:hypothetical protein
MNPISNDLALTPLDQATISQLRLCSPLGFNLRTPYADAGARSPGGTRSTRQASSSNRLNGSTPVARVVRPAISLDRRGNCSASTAGTPGTPLTNDRGRLVSSTRMTLDYSTCTATSGSRPGFLQAIRVRAGRQLARRRGGHITHRFKGTRAPAARRLLHLRGRLPALCISEPLHPERAEGQCGLSDCANNSVITNL